MEVKRPSEFRDLPKGIDFELVKMTGAEIGVQGLNDGTDNDAALRMGENDHTFDISLAERFLDLVVRETGILGTIQKIPLNQALKKVA